MDVRIRRYEIGDAGAVFEAARESMNELQPWMPWCHPGYSIADSISWLQTHIPAFDAGTSFEFAIESADGRYLGGCGLNQLDTINNRANLGYWVRSSATRRGVASAAVHALRDWAFEHTNLIRLEIVIAAGNLASHGVANKTGAVHEGTLHRRLLLYGIAHDATMFSFTRPPTGR